jgi:apolipoprotein N-acyltransferase
MIYHRLERLTEAASRTKPDLIIWPETATPEPLEYDPAAMRIITGVVARSGAYLLTGSMTVTRNLPRTQSDPSNPERVWYNSAFLINPQGKLMDPYHKQHLVPFGEFVPLAKIFPFMKYTTPIPGSFGRGKERTLFPIRPSTLNSAPRAREDFRSRPSTFGVVICFEDVFPDVFRRFVKDGANLMVNITNDAWYKESAGAYQHMANSVFRAVENRVPFVRCANTGYSCFIDSTGRIRAHIAGNEKEGIFVQGFRTEKVTLRNPSEPLTFYARYGDVFAWSCFGVAVIAWGSCLRLKRNR